MTVGVRIYVALMQEDVDVWRPVEALRVHDDVYLIIDQPYDRNVEKWEFEPGDRVHVKLRDSNGERILVATRKAVP